mmetsp:Transcript_33376/g.60147  ORF Transcript_33376/g.60147 Transcript_33376/m.60147 type:complete len:335 (-) Transcript_33376:141-1145(-)|eukprot:CAMPEP_0201865704 /NCGR_PEP_ID=MMETSP0902-20130614/520_1 /ASSEMBLY_ACC=CAM_ASM_000551 /TAXON_ID=420261 /ORGANISM="Thalassiosira antarctica, Strain CCMP982" /LENGTH=334 /DNA_ID=CAMNT_0048390529 /DNA_START=42 /DNA_END=1046 /DNA_ORIENTATION=+
MTGRNTNLIGLLVAIAISFDPSSLFFFAHASNFNKPHSHTGKVEPFLPGDPKVKLDGKAQNILKAGKPYSTQVESGDGGGRGLVVQDVNAPTHIVWGRILDYDNYGSMVPKTIDSKNYKVIPHKPTKANNFLEKEIYTRMKVGFPMLKLEFFVRHFLYIQQHKSLTWTLDYTKESDFDDSCGYWYIIPHPDDPEERTRLYYSVQVGMFDWVPKFVVDFMSSKALTDATAWVKKYSELEWVKAKKEGTAHTTPQPKAKEPIFALPFGKRKREEEEQLAREAAEKAALAERAEAEERNKSVVVRAGWRRYVLVSVVIVLAVYNSTMFFSDHHEKSE